MQFTTFLRGEITRMGKYFKINLVFLTVLGNLIFLIGCSNVISSEFSIKVSGTSNAGFSGSYMTTTIDGKSVSKSVEGNLPITYKVEGNMVSVVFQKKDKEGNLKVEIFKDGKVVSEGETSAEYGVVTIATQ